MQGEIRGYFELEARELVDRLTAGVAGLDGITAPAASIQPMLRAAHTLKGASHVVEEAELASLAHRVEDALTGYREQPGPVSLAPLVSLTDALAASLRKALAPPAAQLQGDGHPTGDEAMPAWDAHTVRVPAGDADRLHARVDESLAVLGSLRQTVARLEQLDRREAVFTRTPELAVIGRALADDADRLNRELEDLHRIGSQLRLLPVDRLLLEAGRIVRSTAQRLGRPVRMLAAGQQERVSPAVLAAMQDALLHLLRNAVAHGLEDASERRAMGKPAEGTIRVEVKRVGPSVQLVCHDDGRGIALEPLRAKAVERGTLTQAEAENATAETLLGLLLLPGFSTAQTLSEVAGRGVGLDAVGEAAARVGGRVTIETMPGQGSTFTFHAPQPVFLVQALEVEESGRSFAVPTAALERIFLFEESLRCVSDARKVRVDGELLPLVELRELVGASAAADSGRRRTCLVLRSEPKGASHTQRLVLTVDRSAGVASLLVQPMAPIAAVSALIAGVALGPSGLPLPLLEPAACLSVTSLAAKFTAAPASPAPRAVKPILVIDDSLTTRMLEQSILETEGYKVELAASAEQGLVMARAGDHALYLVDAEMPGMNGFEFLETVTADARLCQTPAMLVTSLSSDAHRERGRRAGAVGHIVKGEFNQQLYLDRIRALVGGAS